MCASSAPAHLLRPAQQLGASLSYCGCQLLMSTGSSIATLLASLLRLCLCLTLAPLPFASHLCPLPHSFILSPPPTLCTSPPPPPACHFLWFSGTVRTPLLVEQDAAAGTMQFWLDPRSTCGHLAALEGSWTVEAGAAGG